MDEKYDEASSSLPSQPDDGGSFANINEQLHQGRNRAIDIGPRNVSIYDENNDQGDADGEGMADHSYIAFNRNMGGMNENEE